MAKARKEVGPRTANEKWRHVSVYLPNEVFDTVERMAKDSRRSVSAQIVVLVEAQTKK